MTRVRPPLPRPDHHPRRRALAATLFTALAASVLAGCSGSETPPAAPPLLLSGPETNIVVTIPGGWHQVINTANPVIPEMVTPTDCMGSNEIACATGLARVATTLAPSEAEAVKGVVGAVLGEKGVTPGPTISEGPGKVGQRDGYRHRFQFRNQRSGQTAEVAAVASGPVVPDPQGNREFSVVLVWVSDQPGSPAPAVIDEIVTSTLIHGGENAR